MDGRDALQGGVGEEPDSLARHEHHSLLAGVNANKLLLEELSWQSNGRVKPLHCPQRNHFDAIAALLLGVRR